MNPLDYILKEESKMPGASPMVKTIEFKFIPAQAFKHGRTMTVQSIILHSTDGREAGDIATLTGNSVSVHWYVTRTGEIFHFVDNSDTAFHAGKVIDPIYSNSASIGIEQEHFDPDPANGHPNNENWPDIQVETVAHICAFLMQTQGLDIKDIHSHQFVAAPPGRKQDPVGYPFQEKLFPQIREDMQFKWVAVNINGD